MHRFSRTLLGALTSGLLVAPLLATGPATADPASPAPDHSSAAASRALDRARALFDSSPAPARRAGGGAAERRASGGSAAPGRREATLVLNDLATHLDGLDRADRRTATQILARPTAGSSDPQGFGYPSGTNVETICGTHVCVHWATSGADAPSPEDLNGNGVPDQVERTADTFDHVWDYETGTMGYRKPMPDGTRGTDTLYAGPGQPEQQMTDAQKAMLDVYLVESGNQGIYGYCAPDLKAPHTATTAPGYCGVDNDFSTSEFGAGTDPVVSLEATAAHEFFHAVQFGYDRLDDTWLMESTAAWIEDEVYNDANDNRQYLSTSGPLTYPGAPLDFYDPNPSSSSYYTPYGDWIFWKLVSETYSPDLIRQVWYRASRSGQYSVSALRSVLADHGTTLTRFFARFGAVNRYPAKVYSEGRYYPRAPLARTFVMSPDRLVQRPLQAQMSQLSNLSVQYKAKDTLTGTRSLRIRLDMAPTYRGSAATLVVHFRDGSLSRRPVGLDAAGNGAITVPFTRSVVANVELTLTNASGRFDCSARDYRRACHGTPKDEGVAAAFTASVVR